MLSSCTYSTLAGYGEMCFVLPPGSTDTSLWTHYRAGEREYCGNRFPDGLRKNDRSGCSTRALLDLVKASVYPGLWQAAGCHAQSCTPKVFSAEWNAPVGNKLWRHGGFNGDDYWLLRRLEGNVVTPTTKAADHDVPISPEEIVRQGLVSQEDWDTVSSKASPPAGYDDDILASEQHS